MHKVYALRVAGQGSRHGRGLSGMEHKDCGDEQPAKRQRVGEDCADAMVTEESAHICAKRAAPATSQPACLTSRDKILAVERDYTHFYLLDVMDEPGADQFVYKHFNSLCVVGVAPSHVAFANGRKVQGPGPSA
jgi:hypothetical protein